MPKRTEAKTSTETRTQSADITITRDELTEMINDKYPGLIKEGESVAHFMDMAGDLVLFLKKAEGAN